MFRTAKRHFQATTAKLAMKQDPYQVLGVNKSASQADIKKAYFKLAKKFHPDAFQNKDGKEKEEAKQKFLSIQEAYDLLGDENKRANFDRFGDMDQQQQGGFQGAQAEDIFRNIFRQGSPFAGAGGFGDMFGNTTGAQQSNDEDGGDIQTRLQVSFMDAIKGVRTSLSYMAYATCRTCSGSGFKAGASPKTCSTCNGSGEQMMSRGGFRIMMTCTACGGAGQSIKREDYCSTCGGECRTRERVETYVNVPAGIDNDERLRVIRKGHAPVGRGTQGDLYVTIQVAEPVGEERVFKRAGADINVDVNVPLSGAIFGTNVNVPTLEGVPYKLKVPAGSQSGDLRVLAGRGVQKLQQPAGIKGNLNVRLKVDIPNGNRLPSEQRQVLEKYREMVDGPQQKSEGFIHKTFEKLKDRLCDHEDKKQSAQ